MGCLTTILPSSSELETTKSMLSKKGFRFKVVSKSSKGPNLILDINTSSILIFRVLLLPELFVNK